VGYRFVPGRKDAEFKTARGHLEDIGEYARTLDVEDIKQLLRDGVREFVELDGIAQLWIPPSECFEYWKWAQPNIHTDERPYLDDYPYGFFLTPHEFKSHAGERLIVLKRFH
jgi:hypothetical protein